jgi:hypothetical protein
VQELHDPDRRVRVEVARRLVADQERRMVDHRARDRDALLLAAGQLPRERRRLVREADERERLGHLLANRLGPVTLHLQRVRHVLGGRPVGQELEVLEHAPEVAPEQRNLRVLEPTEVAPADDDPPPRRLELLEEQANDRRLARPRCADDEDELALLDRERDVS